MIQSVSFDNWVLLNLEEIASATSDYKSDLAVVESKIQRAQQAGDYAKAVAPAVLMNALAIATLDYLRVFTLLSFLNCRVATYAVPAAASYAVNALAEKAQPVMNTVGNCAGYAAREMAMRATMNAHDWQMIAV